MPLTFHTLTLALLLATAVPVRAADDPASWPVRRPGTATPAPCWAGDVLGVRLTPAAARALVPRGGAPLAARPLARTGVAALDRIAGSLRAEWRPVFPGEAAPAAEGAPDFTAYLTLQLPPDVSLEQAERALAGTPGLAHVERLAILPVSAVPNDSLLFQQPWLRSNGPLPRHDVRAPEAWDLTTGDTSVVVGIIDSGMLPYHPDLGGTDGGRGNRYINWSEATGLPGVDDDGNGYVDDVSGWDFVDVPAAVVRPGEDKADPDNDPNDYAGHGTLVSGIVGALTNNAAGVAGIAWRVRLLPLRIAWSTSANPLGEVRMDFAAAAVRYATRMGARVVNCSFSSLNQSGIDLAVEAATRAGTLVVVAAGNSGQVHYLGDRDDTVCIAATDSLDQVPSFSNRYLGVDLAAQGVGVWSTSVIQAGADSLGYRQPSYAALSGTSFSSPQVAGALALLDAWDRSHGEAPRGSLARLLRVRETTDDIAALNPTRPLHGTGRLNLLRMLTDPAHSAVVPAGARTLGPPVVLEGVSGARRAYWVTNDSRLVAIDGATLDTVVSVALPHPPSGVLAASDLGQGLGIALAIGTSDGLVLVRRPDGSALPAIAADGLAAGASPASEITFRDADGDGVRSIVAATAASAVVSWDPRTGDTEPGFPLAVAGPGAPRLAAAPIGGADALVVAAGDGTLHLLDGAGAERTGWPVTLAGVPLAPLVMRIAGGDTAVVVAAGGQLTAYRADGTPAWTQTLPGILSLDPAAADLDGDGTREILLGYASPIRLERRDGAGVAATTGGWPIGTGFAPTGTLLAGPLRAGARMGVMVTINGALTAYSDSGQMLPEFPKPGGATGPAALADPDRDGATEVLAGSASDSSLVFYEAAAASAAVWPATWPAPRGGDARRGDAVTDHRPLVWDDVPPAAPEQLAAEATGSRSLRVTWLAAGDDSLNGRAFLSSVQCVPTSSAGGATPFGVTRAAGQERFADSLVVAGGPLVEGAEYDVTVRYIDDQGNAGPVAGPVRVALPVPVRTTVADLGVAPASDSAVTLAWTAPPAASDAAFTVAAALAPLDSAGFDSAPVRVVSPAPGEPGAGRQLMLGGLASGRRWFFAVRVEDGSGEPRGISNVVSLVVGPGGRAAGRDGIALFARVNPSGRPVVFDWLSAAPAGTPHQVLSLYDPAGRLVRRFDLGADAGGALQWNGRDEAGRLVPAGIYFARLTSGSLRATARVALLP